MVPYDGPRFMAALTRAVVNSDVRQARIDDAVRRVLTIKFELGLFENPFGDASLLPLVGCEAHRAVARDAVRESLVLLKNDGGTLPLARNTPVILVAGGAADDVGLQCGGWTVAHQGGAGAITEGTTLLQGIRRAVSDSTAVRYHEDGEFGEDQAIADVGIVVLGEQPYAEGPGDRADLTLPVSDVALLERVRPLCRKLVVVLITGRPRVVTEHLPRWDALVIAWLPGTEGDGVAQVLFGELPFSGRLPHSWPSSMAQIPRKPGDPALFPVGYGLSGDPACQAPVWNAHRTRIRRLRVH
jgi:beta-glucosidase